MHCLSRNGHIIDTFFNSHTVYKTTKKQVVLWKNLIVLLRCAYSRISEIRDLQSIGFNQTTRFNFAFEIGNVSLWPYWIQ